MSQIGKLSKISIDKILKWAEKGTKTGAFSFSRGEERKFLYFKDGSILSASSNNPKERLGQVMVRIGMISQQQIETVQDIQRKEKLQFGKVLFKLNLVTQQDIVVALKQQTEDIIINLFDWEDGEFLFYLNKTPPAEIMSHTFDLDAIIAAGMKRKVDWSALKRTFPTVDIVLDISFTVPDDSGGNQQLSEQEFKLMTLVDGMSSIQEINLSSEFPEFDTVKTLEKLLQGGYIVIKDEDDSDDDDAMDDTDVDDNVQAVEAVSTVETIAAPVSAATNGVEKEVRKLLESGDSSKARAFVQEFRQKKGQSDRNRELLTLLRLTIIQLENVPQLVNNSSEEKLKQEVMDPKSGFILSRIDGRLNIKLLSNISGFPKDVVQEIVFDLFIRGIIDVKITAAEVVVPSRPVTLEDSSPGTMKPSEEEIRKRILDKYQHMAQADYYEVLGVTRNVDSGDLKKAYHGMAKLYHPDMVKRAGDTEILQLSGLIFDKIQLAYDTLSDDEKRANYDRAKGYNLTEEEQRRIARCKAKAGLQYQIGMKAYKTRNYKKAMEFIKSAIDINPTESVYYGILAEIQAKNPKWFGLARESLAKAIELDPHNAMFYITLGSIDLEDGQPEDAATAFHKALFYDPGNETALAELKKMGREVKRKTIDPFDKIITKDIAIR